MSQPNRRLLLLELNEFNRELLADASAELGLRHIQTLLGMHESVTRSVDEREGETLDPWVQWVSVHTGKPSAEHGIRHLGEVPDLRAPQIWELLAERGVTTGVWGAMNGSRGRGNGCAFFLPDPWTFSERGHPGELDRLLGLPRYMARNYLNASPAELAKQLVRFASVVLKPPLVQQLVVEAPRVLNLAARFGRANFVPFCVTEYLSGLLFLEYRRRYQPRFSVLFLNTVAHLQHYYWTPGAYRGNRPLEYGLRYVDRLLGRIYASLAGGEVLVALNGFCQVPATGDDAAIMYRQYDHSELLDALGIEHTGVEALMTNDAHVFLPNAERCAETRAILEEATVDGRRVFAIEAADEHPERLFYRIVYHREAVDSTRLVANGRELRFLDLFKPVGRRTGMHSPRGSLFCTEPLFPAELPNHEVFDHVVRFFDA